MVNYKNKQSVVNEKEIKMRSFQCIFCQDHRIRLLPPEHLRTLTRVEILKKFTS